MKIYSLICLTFVALQCVLSKDEAKLQIGIKKRVDCQEGLRTRKGDFVHVHYKGTLQKDGSEFDSSYPRGNPFTFTLGSNQVIKGWDQGLLGMCEGEKRRLIIPPELGYGRSGSGAKIPPDSTLIFEVELLKIEKRQENEEL